MKTWTNEDKTDWPEGPWKEEPDKAQWRDEETGLPCLIVRNRLGALCGYAGVYPDHPMYQKDYSEVWDEDIDIDVHGGLTFSDACAEDRPENEGICHVPEPGEQPVWWFGFDCSHAGDLNPKLPLDDLLNMGFGLGIEYRDFSYVKDQVTSLAKQLKAVQ